MNHRIDDDDDDDGPYTIFPRRAKISLILVFVAMVNVFTIGFLAPDWVMVYTLIVLALISGLVTVNIVLSMKLMYM
jgi:hypothetical protein